MIAGEFRLRNYSNWRILYFIITDANDADVILDELNQLRCGRKFMRRAEKLLYSGARNIGLTYTKSWLRTSVFVISKTTDVWEFFNSFAHEVDHIEKHIAKALSFNPYSEKASYLVGEFIREMFYNIFKNHYARIH